MKDSAWGIETQKVGGGVGDGGMGSELDMPAVLRVCAGNSGSVWCTGTLYSGRIA